MKKFISFSVLVFFAVAIAISWSGNKISSEIETPDSLTISYDDSTSIVTLEWDSVSGAEKYYIYGKTIPDSIDLLLDSTTVTNWSSNFAENKYFFEVTALGDDGIPEGMVFVQGTTFSMGDRHGDYIIFDCIEEIPVHNVTVNDFYIAEYEVTQSEWSQYMTGDFNENDGMGPNHPAYNLSWYEILVYCNKRSISEDLTPCYSISASTNPDDWGSIPTSVNATWDAVVCNWEANGCRMPTEAEWEYAGRGGLNHTDNYRYSGCNEENEVEFYAIMQNDSVYSAMTVGLKLPNQLGIYDMSGNIAEFVWDWHDYPDYTYYEECFALGTVDNPKGPGSGTRKVEKGGHWYGAQSGWFIRVAQRWPAGTYGGSYAVGFRIAQSVIEE